MQAMKTTPFDSQSKVGGHPVHPTLVVFPIALITLAVVTDLVFFSTDGKRWADFTVWLLVFGIGGGGVAAGVGWIDWLGLPKGSRAKSVGLYHAAVNNVALILAAVSLLLRVLDDNDTGVLPFLALLLSVGAIFAGGYLGGELVYKLGVAVDREAFAAVEEQEANPGTVRPSRVVRG